MVRLASKFDETEEMDFSFTSTMVRFQFFAAKFWATARPIPDPPPVISATGDEDGDETLSVAMFFVLKGVENVELVTFQGWVPCGSFSSYDICLFLATLSREEQKTSD